LPAIIKTRREVCGFTVFLSYFNTTVRVTTFLENPGMSGNFAVVREISGKLAFCQGIVRGMSGKNRVEKTVVFNEQTSLNWRNTVLLDMDRT